MRIALPLLALLLLTSCGDDTGRNLVVTVPPSPAPPPFAPDIGGPAALPGGGYDYNLTIVFTNDIHDQVLPVDGLGGGLARHATLMSLLRQQANDRGIGLLAANAGDCWEGTLFYERDGGTTVYRLLELMGYDVIQVGNHEHQFGVQRVYDVLRAAFPGLDQDARFLFGNVNPQDMYAAGSGPYTGTQMYVPATVDPEVIDSFESCFTDPAGNIDTGRLDAPFANSRLFNQTLFFDRGGIRIGMFGMDTSEILYTIVPSGDLLLAPDDYAQGLIFYDEIASSYASSMIDYLDDPDGDPGTDDGADVIVMVSHIGVDKDEAVARAAVGQAGRRIDVIVGGHSHTRINRELAIDHGGGQKTCIVQADSRGLFLGRLDLMVDPVADRSTVSNAELVQVVPEIPEDPDAAALIQDVMSAPGGVDQFYGDPFDTVVASATYSLPAQVGAPHAIGRLTAEACLGAVNAAPTSLGVDLMLLSGFAYRSDLCMGPVTIADVHALLPLHVPDPTGLEADAVHFIDLPGGLREAANLADFPAPLPNLTDITTVEYFLELVYSLTEIITGLAGSGSGIELDSVLGIINGLQWAGVDVVVDSRGPIMQRIDPATIFIGGVPLSGNEDRDWRLGMSSILAELVVPILSVLLKVEDPPGSGTMVPFPDYDPATNGSPVIVWEALRDALQSLQVIDAAASRAPRDGPRTMAPDLTFDPLDAVVSPQPQAGATISIQIPVINLGETGVDSATVSLVFDPTPGLVSDNPDGLTDARTGFAFSPVGSATVAFVPGFSGGDPVPTWVMVDFAIPAGLAAGTYPVFATIENVVSVEPTLPEEITSNNGGTSYPILVRIP